VPDQKDEAKVLEVVERFVLVEGSKLLLGFASLLLIPILSLFRQTC
jgi:hypothetical protein